MTLRLDQRFVAEMIAHAQQMLPREACGILAGPPGGPVQRLYRATNRLGSETEYEIDPRELLQILRALDEEGWADPLAIYHSHPRSAAYPSRTDLARATTPDGSALYPDTVYVIISLVSPEEPVLRGFRVDDGQMVEVPLVIT